MERPALRQLLAEVEAGQVDCVVVYKVDRLSRSLLDFARLIELFDRFRRQLRFCDTGVQHHHLAGAIDAEHPVIVCAV